MQAPLDKKRVISWALYDWANSAFACSVMVVFFPLFFKQTLTVGQSATTSTFWLGMINGISSFVLAVLAPWLGTLADKGNAHVRMLLLFTAVGVVPTALLAWVGSSDWQTAAVLFGIASLGFWGGVIFYDSMLVQVAPRERLSSVSGYGYALGYLGGGLLLTLNVLMYNDPALFGLPSKEAAARIAFVSVAAWWALFAIPLLRLRPRTDAPRLGFAQAWRESFAELASTFRQVRRYRQVVLFLFAYWLYIDGVNTVMKMSVDYGLALKFKADTLLLSILLIQFIGFPATLLFGWLGDRISALLGIFVGIGVYSLVTLYAARMTNETEFFVMGAAIGCVQGAIQALSRSYYGELIPAERSGEFYGFYNMMGKFAAVLGPLLMGITARVTGDSRTSIVSLVVLFAGGAAMLWWCSRARPGAEQSAPVYAGGVQQPVSRR